jgi:CHAT domain-containing protein
MSEPNPGYHFLQLAKAAHAVGNLISAKENATVAAGYFKDRPDHVFEYLDCITLLQTVASIHGDWKEYSSLEPLIKNAIYQIFRDKAPCYYALHQYDSSEFYMNRGMLVDSYLILEQAYNTLLTVYGSLPIILFQHHYFLSRYWYQSENYYSCIDSCLITNDLWVTLEETEQEDYGDEFLTTLYQNGYNISRMGLLNAILLASSYGKLNNSEAGIQILQSIPNSETPDYYIRSAIDLNLAELHARNHNYQEALSLMEPYRYADYSNYPDLATCVDTIHFAVNYSTGFHNDLPLRSPWLSKISDTISNDYMKIHRFNMAVALASQGQYEESLALSNGIGETGLSLRMALYHELKYFTRIQEDFPKVYRYYLSEIENIFTHYNDELVYHHLDALEYHISLCLGALLSEDFRRSSSCLTGEQLYEFYLNTKGISLEGSYILRQYSDAHALKNRSFTKVCDLQRHLAKDSILLEYVLSRTLNEVYYGVFIVGCNQVDFQPLGREAEVNELLFKFQDYLQDDTGRLLSEPEIHDLQSKLRRKLILPLKKYLSKIKQLIIAPVGGLYHIPFDVLTITSTQELGSLYRITYLNIGRELALIPSSNNNIDIYISNNNIRYSNNNDILLSQSLIIGNPKVHRLPDLPFAALETKAAGELVQAKVYHGSDASINLFYSDNLQPPLLHIAAHGFFRKTVSFSDSSATASEVPEDPMRKCGMFLADEYPLTADEISSLNLSTVKLCILSACYSGLGESKGNEGTFGLRRGFFLAGCHSLLLSLWSIHDFSGMLFIYSFYEGLITMQLNTYEALQATKQTMRSRTIRDWKPLWEELLKSTASKVLSEAIQAYSFQNDDYIPFEHPYHWAGYQLIGNPVSLL